MYVIFIFSDDPLTFFSFSQINTSAPIRPHKRRVTRDTPSTKDTPISTKTKFKFQTDSVTNLESNLDQSPSFESIDCLFIE